MWKRDEAVKAERSGRPAAAPAQHGQCAANRGGGAATASARRRSAWTWRRTCCEHRQIGRHQGRAERQRRSDDRRTRRRQDRAAPARADDRPERQDQGAGVRQVGDRPRRGHRQRHARARRSTSATTARSTATSSSPRVAIAEGAHFRGSIDMQKGGGQSPKASRPAQPRTAQPAGSSARRCRRRPLTVASAVRAVAWVVTSRDAARSSGCRSSIPCCQTFSAGAGSAPASPTRPARRPLASGGDAVVRVEGASEVPRRACAAAETACPPRSSAR